MCVVEFTGVEERGDSPDRIQNVIRFWIVGVGTWSDEKEGQPRTGVSRIQNKSRHAKGGERLTFMTLLSCSRFQSDLSSK